MSRFSHRHAALLRRRRAQSIWASAGLSLGILGAAGGLLALQMHYSGHEQTGQVMVCSWVAPAAPPHTQPPALPLPPFSESVPLPQLPVLQVEPLPADTPEIAALQLPEHPILWQEDEPYPPPATPAPPPRRAARPAPLAAAAPAAQGEYSPPAYLQAPKPPYPAAMRQSRAEGSVRLRISIDPLGHPQNVEIVSGSGHPEFDHTARRWVLEHWRFTPARRGQQAVPGTVLTSVHFVLN